MLHSIDLRLRLLAGATALVFLVILIVLLKRRLLKHNWTILWIVFALAMAFMAIDFNFLFWISGLVGVKDPNHLLFFVSIVLLTLILIMASIDISDMQKHIKNMNQEISILKALVEKESGLPGLRPPAKKK